MTSAVAITIMETFLITIARGAKVKIEPIIFDYNITCWHQTTSTIFCRDRIVPFEMGDNLARKCQRQKNSELQRVHNLMFHYTLCNKPCSHYLYYFIVSFLDGSIDIYDFDNHRNILCVHQKPWTRIRIFMSFHNSVWTKNIFFKRRHFEKIKPTIKFPRIS